MCAPGGSATVHGLLSEPTKAAYPSWRDDPPKWARTSRLLTWVVRLAQKLMDFFADNPLDAPVWGTRHRGDGTYSPRRLGLSLREVWMFGENPDWTAVKLYRLARDLESAGIDLDSTTES